MSEKKTANEATVRAETSLLSLLWSGTALGDLVKRGPTFADNEKLAPYTS